MRFLLSYEEKAFETGSAMWHHIVNQEEIESISVDDDVAIANVEDIEVYEKAKRAKYDTDWITIF